MATVVEFTRTSVRLLQAEGAGRSLRIRRLLVGAMASPAQAGEALTRVVKEAKAEGSGVIVTVPREQVITRLLKFPTTRPDELARMVELSGKAQLPYPRDQAVADFQVIEQQAGNSTVQLAACHRELVEQQVRLVRAAGLEPLCVVPSSWGLAVWFQQLIQAADVREPVIIVNVDADHTDLALVAQGRLLFSRSLPQGVGEWRAGQDALGPLAQEIERSLSSVRKELTAADANTIVLTGLGALESWKAPLEARLRKPGLARQMQVPELAGIDNASPAIVVGLAMVDARSLLNLLPLQARQAQDYRRQLRGLAVTGVMLVTALALGVSILSASVDRQAQVTGALVKTVKGLESATQQTEAQEQEVTLIDGTMGARRTLAVTLASLFQSTPGEIVLERVAFERGRRQLAERRTAPTTRQVLDYIRSLEESGRYERVELRYSSRRSTSAGWQAEFEFAAKLKPS